VNNNPRVAAPPAKPLLVYDGDCRFCSLWIQRWEQTTGDRVEYLPFQDPSVSERFPEIPRPRFETAVQLIETDGRVYSAAEAALRALAKNPARHWPLQWYERSPLFARVAERSYHFVAEHRSLFSALTCVAYGDHVEHPSHYLVRGTFLRALGVIYLIAFVSLWTQIDGLIGSKGILPTDQFMQGARRQVEQQQIGLDRYRLLPTLCWWNASDTSLRVQCAAGTVIALLVVIGIAPAPCLFLLWLIYLSLATVCRVLLGFQWDNLLLETGFLAIFLASLQFWPFGRPGREAPPSRLVLWLLRLLLFKLMFQSGCVKLLSGDSSWRDLTALAVHYETQPLPTWIGWYAHQLPLWLQKASCLGMFIIELAIPFLFFAPRRLRIFGAAATALLQIVIILTGNYTFFNWLALALCLTLLDDFALAGFLPFRRRRKGMEDSQPDPVRLLTTAGKFPWRRLVTLPLAIVVLSLNCLQLLATLDIRPVLFKPVVAVHQYLAPFRSLNSYGLFAVMTRTRLEIVIEGSHDGINWRPYEFKHKPGDVQRRPGFVAPHQPRLDWQMWFAALGNWQENPWIINLTTRLLQGSPEVLALLESNPFPDQPPRFIRATRYDYRFTDVAGRKQTGAWWRRTPTGEYIPPISSRQPRVVWRPAASLSR
jgi:predicted DCC family thiol-disulfide oxidoreductase YuxK